MINLKLYGLYRTGTNWAQHCTDQSFFGEVKIHHDTGAWKHGEIQRVKDMDGYILCSKDFKRWEQSMLRYMEDKGKGTVVIDPRLLKILWDGWYGQAHDFRAENLNVFRLHLINNATRDRFRMSALLAEIAAAYELDKSGGFHIEERVMRRNGDFTGINMRTADEKYEAR